MPRIESISRRSSSRLPGGCTRVLVIGFLGIFCVAGTGAGYFLSFRPLYLAYRAQSWTATPCEVISSQVVHSDDTARPDIVYRYRVAEREYTSNRYNFIPGSTNDSTVADTVDRYPAGAKFQCLVDPADPSQAVINATPTLWYFFGLLFFVMFTGIPGTVGLFMLRAQRTVATPPAPGTLQAPDLAVQPSTAFDTRFGTTAAAGGPLVLTSTQSPMTKLVIVTFLCLFWNAITGAFTYFQYQEVSAGGGLGCLALFLVPFQLVGLFLIGAVPYHMLATMNPRPAITLGRGTLPLGGSVSFGWELAGAANRVTRLQMTLRGREEARYRRGTDTRVDTSTFYSQTIVDATHAMNIQRGTGTLQIPADTMHSFEADNNKIVWTLQVTGTIERWPDVDESFEVTVTPV